MAAPVVLGQAAIASDSTWSKLADQSKYPGWGMDGNELHGMGGVGGGIPVKCWCCTREDLIMLREEIKLAIRGGVIHPTDRDKFDLNDEVIGPNMYTVCDQYIKPLTKEAGSMSWALLRNPRGLECDLFITHAWIEGMFEFIDKVVGSWPHGKTACYVCVLSNPQNLDIAELIKTPRTSPFALCLESASHMLVTPNHHSSIYSRLWCVYEAWLAYTLGKTILTARPRQNTQQRNALLLLCIPLGLGVLYRVAVDEYCADMKGAVQIGMFLILFAKLLNVFSCCHPKCSQISSGMSRALSCRPVWLVVDWMGAFWCGSVIAIEVGSWDGHCGSSWAEWSYRWCLVVLILYFFGSEIDRVEAVFGEKEAAQLRNNFGSVCAAECSNAQDGVTIRSEISTDLGDVDMAVSVLLSAGMSTPDLRSAAALGASVFAAGHISVTSIVICVGSWLLLNILFASRIPGIIESIVWCLMSASVTAAFCRLFYIRRRGDQRAFMLSAVGKFLMLGLQLSYASISPDIDGEGLTEQLVLLTLIFMGPALLFSFLGVVRTAKIPLVGPLLAGLLGPGTSCTGFRLLSQSDMANSVERWAYTRETE